MDLKSLSLGERIAALSGAALFVFMFVPWLTGRSAWELFRLIDVVLAIIALTAVALPLVKATGSDAPLRLSTRSVLSRAGLVALTITATFLVEGRRYDVGIFLAVLASAGILYGGMTTPEDGASRERGRRRGTRERRTYSSEDFEEPPPGMEDWRAGATSWGAEDFDEEPLAGGAAGGRERTRRREREPRERERRFDLEEPAPPPDFSEPTEVREPRRRSEDEPPRPAG